MLRSYRCILIALVGWLAAPHVSAQTQQAATEANQAQSAPAVSLNAQPVEAGDAPEYHRPCRDDQSDYNSDLCAQWTAATAAAKSSYWAEWSFWVGLAGFGGLIFTLLYSRKAVIAALHTLDAQIAAERPLLQLSDLEIRKGEDYGPQKSIELLAKWAVTNYGKGACWIEGLDLRIDAGKQKPPRTATPSIALTSFIAPGKTVSASDFDRSYWFYDTLRKYVDARELTIWGFVQYRDVGRRLWRSHFMFHASLASNYTLADFWPAQSDVHWHDGLVREKERKPRRHLAALRRWLGALAT